MFAINQPVRAEISLYRLLINNLPNSAAALFDDTLRIIIAGGDLMPLFGLPGDIEGRHVSEIFNPQENELLSHWFVAALTGTPTATVWPSGDKVFNITVRRLSTAPGTPALGIVVVQDLHALTAEQSARLDEKYERASIAKDLEMIQTKARVIERILHEFRNPLAAAGSSADLLDSYGDAMPAEKRRKHVRVINEEIHRIAAILDDILTVIS
ncbi:MAG: hypothetical protein IPK52_19270 [Chloroflexi bacterium]|nr:hypothetical protein [Chloroflexota bacterium]